MTDPKRVTRQLRDLADWAPLLTDAITTLPSPRASSAPASTHGTHRDLGDLLAPTLDAEDEGAYAIRTHAQIIRWATAWAGVAGLTYAGNPLHALADNTQRLAESWDDWDAFTDDLTILHTRIARITGNASRTIGPCPENGCTEHVTQATTRHGAEGPLECPRGHTWHTHADYQQAIRDADREIARTTTDPTIWITLRDFHLAWPEIAPDTVKKWIKWKRLIPTDDTPKRINLAAANTLARNLIHDRQKRAEEATKTDPQ